MRLPSEYQEVEYIENNGTAYINTGLQVKDGYRFVSKLNSKSQQTGDGGRITGAYLGYQNGIYYRLYFGGIGGSAGTSGWSYGYLGDFNNGTTGSYDLNTDYDVEFSWISGNAFLKVNGTTLKSWSDTYSTTLSYECKLFASNDGTHPGLRVYSAKYYNSTGTLVRDFVPCYRKSDNVIGLYDLVNNQFYTNSGTGTFTKGADIKGYKIKKVYIGTITPEAWEPGSNTVAYFPMRGDFKDYSGGGYDLSITDGSYTLGNEYNTVTNIGGKNTSFTYSTSSSYTLSCWANLTSSANMLLLGSDSASGRGMTVSAQQAACVVNNTQYSTTTATGKLNERCLYTAVFDYTNHKIIYYQNTEKIAEATTSSGGIRGGRWITLNKGSDYASANLNGKLGQMVCENVAWSDNDVADYYNRSRYNYEDMPKYIEIWPGEEPGPEPQPQSGSVDFTAVSLTDLTNAGWTYTNNTPGLDSGGFYCSNTSNDKYSSLWHPIDLTEANKIYIKAIINGSSGSWAGGPSFGIFKDTSSSYPYVSGGLSFTYQNGYNGQGMDINSSGTNNTYKTNSTISGLYTLEVTVDFTTSKASYNLGGVYSTEVNIYPSDAFRQCAYIRCEAGHGIYNGVRIRSIEWDIT